MTKPRRLTQAEIQKLRSEKRQREKLIREENKASAKPLRPPALPNRCSKHESIEEEQKAREEAVSKQFEILRKELPDLLHRLEKIPDPRNPQKRRHKLTVLLLYGLRMFVYPFSSRREVNREMTQPQFEENLRLLFPEIDTLPHGDTLYRLLRSIDVTHIEKAHVDVVRRLLRNKSFRRYARSHGYTIAIDGSQKLATNTPWSEQLLQRTVGKDESRHTQYYVYVLEASLVFTNGFVIPLLSEFLEYTAGATEGKQDCEQRGFLRLTERVKELLPRLPILLVLDGLYADGPVMQRCRRYRWQFLIVLQSDDLKTVWQVFEGLQRLAPRAKLLQWGDRHQRFSWVNNIEYSFGPNERNHIKVHVVVCDESWKDVEIRDKAVIVTKEARHAWLSSEPLTDDNLHERCNLTARYRWGIEAGFLVEKHQGYHYEHSFAYDWNAMRGYHLLMRLAHVFNTLARFSRGLCALYQEKGVRGAIKFIRDSCAAPWLNAARMRALLAEPSFLQRE